MWVGCALPLTTKPSFPLPVLSFLPSWTTPHSSLPFLSIGTMSVPPSADTQQHSPESTTHSPPVVVDPRAPVPPPPPSASQSIPVSSDFTNEQIEEFLSNNPELANMTDEQLASGNLEGMDTGSVRFFFCSIFPPRDLL